MTPPSDLRPLPGLLFVMLLMSLPAAALEPETCFSRQHQGAAINVRVALSRDAAAMMARIVRSERDCVLACCSEEVRTGARCNMAVFKANKQAGEHNCLLFHCPTELDCPLMKAAEGSNTYDIYKGLSHPPTLRPVPMTTTLQTTSTSTSTTSAPTTPTTTQPTSTTSTPTTVQALHSTPQPSPPIIIIATEPAGSPPTNTTTTTTTTIGPSSTFTTRKPNKTSKKQNKTTKKAKSHPALTTTTTTTQTAPSSMTSLPAETGRKEVEDKHTSVPETTTSATTTTVAPATSTTTTTPTTTVTFPITTTTLPPTTISTTEPTTTVTAQPPSLIFIPKDPVQSEPDLQPGHPTLNSSSSRGKAVAAQGALKGSVVAFMVLALAVLTLALAVGGRKAMESFDRRHYTRLELNDLHYEI
ncbi:MANSC domain-containing protein 1 [Poecilia latipinna]|uniref:MANSC domain-containing protein 1 n=1 Tax=Poecilia latipinna TaxID=48699 RepID=UPI00072E7B09|nr:PREDICTED: MANSC domain-containing protein 1 [Poecilia latipinna]